MVRTRNDASNTISSLICIFSMSFPGSRRCLTHPREMFLEHVHLTSPWADYIGIPLFRGVFYSPGSHSRALWKGERLEILRRREYCESENRREDAWHVSRIRENYYATERKKQTIPLSIFPVPLHFTVFLCLLYVGRRITWSENVLLEWITR